MEDLSSNPFVQLFPSIEDARSFIQKESDLFEKSKLEKILINNEVFEKSLLLTFDKDGAMGHPRPSHLVYMSGSHAGYADQTWLEPEHLDQVICERILLVDKDDMEVVTFKNGLVVDREELTESDAIRYLFSAYQRTTSLCHHYKANWLGLEAAKLVKQSILRQGCFYLTNSLEMEDTSTGGRLFRLVEDQLNHGDVRSVFNYLNELVSEVASQSRPRNTASGHSFADIMGPLVDAIEAAQKEAGLDCYQLCCPELHRLANVVQWIVTVPDMAELFLDRSTPSATSSGRSYERTLLGRFLCPSHMPTSPLVAPQFFNRHVKQEVELDEARVWEFNQSNWNRFGELFLTFLRVGKGRPDVKRKLFRWIGGCIHANHARAQLGQSLSGMPLNDPLLAGDGFFMNFLAVLLRLAKPLVDAEASLMDKIQLQYADDKREGAVALTGLDKETRLIPLDSLEDTAPTDTVFPEHYSALTELFFMLHATFRLSFVVVSGKFLEGTRNMEQIESAWRDVDARGVTGTPEGQRAHQMLTRGVASYLTQKAALAHPELLRPAAGFLFAGTARLLCGLTQAQGRRWLASLPEAVAENVVELAVFLQRFKDECFESLGIPLDPLMSFIVIFMGTPACLKNPYLRAKLAEVLEALLPFRETEQTSNTLISFVMREALLDSHPLLDQVVSSLLTAFVTIEMTGEGVHFEEKFAYRRPMYVCMRYFHDKERFDRQYKKLESDALTNIDDPEAPLFLRFLNMLMNDAIFLVDEALQYLALLKKKEAERASHPGDRYPSAREESNFQHVTMLARYHNSLGRSTIDQLSRMAGLCRGLLVHPVLVERVAAMLNYFLVKLVGPKQSEYAVKDKVTYSFRPGELVSVICHIYVSLSGETAFRTAVVSDGRSYSDGLLDRAARVLEKVCEPEARRREFKETSVQIKTTSAAQQEEDEVFEDAPEEYKDPIMDTLMRDPVTLPSSGQVVDRQTIARHLLSDPTDPFNRSHLNMTMVVPNHKLRAEIHRWIQEKRLARINTQQSSPGGATGGEEPDLDLFS